MLQMDYSLNFTTIMSISSISTPISQVNVSKLLKIR